MEIRRVRMLLVPTKKQEDKFWQYVNYFRRTYNLGLEWCKEHYETWEELLYFKDLSKILTEYKQDNPDFYSIDSHTLKQALKNVSTAFKRFATGKSKYPNFKSFKKSRKSFYTRQDKLKVYKKGAKLSSIGYIRGKSCHWLLDRYLDREDGFKVYNPYVVFDGKYWFLSFGVDVSLSEEQHQDKVVGIDLGINHTAVTSENKYYDNINRKRKIMILKRRKKRFQRVLSRKYERNKEGNKFVKTNNIKKLEQKIRLIDRRIRNLREEHNHKIVNNIIKDLPKMVVIETLKVKNMLKNKYLSESIAEQNFYRLKSLLREKCKNMLIELIEVDWNFPSSKLCSGCRNKKKDLTLNDREYICKECGLVLDRDYNASLNLRNYGMSLV